MFQTQIQGTPKLTAYIQNYIPKFGLVSKLYSAPVSKSYHAKSKPHELEIQSS